MPTPASLLQPLDRIERALEGAVSAQPTPADLAEAMAYALLAPGKRVRPLLAWHACVAVGGEGPESLPACVALECVHAFSLVHDDLPAMDDDDLRRGRPTLHIARGEAMAILAGDALLAMAFGELTDGRLSPELGVALCRELFEGTRGMIAGQVFDTLGNLPDALGPVEQVRLIHASKTGALITAACRMGALSGLRRDDLRGATAFDALTEYGRHVGLMFQVVDDLLDLTSTPEHTGKRTKKDAAAGKRTFPSAAGVDGARREVARLHSAAINALEPVRDRAGALRDLVDWLAVRTA
jgi:geranylgeranyl pyrophosphate synthase